MEERNNMNQRNQIDIGTVNCIALFSSIPVLLLLFIDKSNCESFLEKYIILITMFIIIGVMFVRGIMRFCNVSLQLLDWVYMLVMFALLVLLFCVSVFAFVSSSSAKRVISSDHHKYYSNWLEKRFEDSNRWNEVKTCLFRHKRKICKGVMLTAERTVPTLPEFRYMQKKFTSTESACCKPPDECNFEYVSPIVWTRPTEMMNNNSTNADCGLWENSTLCFDCSSCKADFIHNIKFEWRADGVLTLLFLIIQANVYYFSFRVLRSGTGARVHNGQLELTV